MVTLSDSRDEAGNLHLSKAPIVEAIIAIEFSTLSAETIADFNLVYEALSALYQSPQPLIQSNVQFTFPSGPMSQDTLHGLRFVSHDGLYAVQLRPDAFIFSHLAPYASWNSFRGEALAVWSEFKKNVAPLEMRTLGLRYVNKISFPANEPIARYLRLYATVPDSTDGGPQELTGGYVRLQIQLADPSGQLVVQEVLLPTEKEGESTVALDNDFRFNILGFNEEKVWSLLDQARELKNRYFVHFITKELLESYR